jgi:hypothetical protein
MIGKLPVLGFALVASVSSTALAHEDCDKSHGHGSGASHGSYRHSPGPAPSPVDYRHGYAGRAEVDLRYADLNRDGWVTMQEALDSGRQSFRYNDRDNDRVLTRREMGRVGVRRGDRDVDGRVTMYEYQRSVRARFASLDTNRDGVLARYELGLEPQRSWRSAGWLPYR